MSVQARVNQMFGGSDGQVTVTATAAGTIAIPDISSWINVTAASGVTVGSSTVPVFSMPASARNRLVILYNSGSQSVTLTNTDTSSMSAASNTVVGFTDLGGSNFVMGATDLIALYVRPDGSAIRVFSTDN